MNLEERLKKLNEINKVTDKPDWVKYKEKWISDVQILENTIVFKWFNDYEEKKLMEFSLIPVQRYETQLDNYTIMLLEINLSNNKFLALEPIAAITSEFEGMLEFYMRGNVYKKINILRKTNEDKPSEWYISKKSDSLEYDKLNKVGLEKIIEEWL